MVGGATLIGRRLDDDRLFRSMSLAAVVNGVAVFAAAAFAVLPLAIALFVIGGLANGVETVAMRSLIVHRVADRLRARACVRLVRRARERHADRSHRGRRRPGRGARRQDRLC